MVAQRLVREYISQIVAFGVAIADRILVAAVLVRYWGVDDFAAWTVAVSFAGITSVFDFGVNLYFSNQLMFKVQSRNQEDALRYFHAGNSAALLSAGTGFFVALLAILISVSQISSIAVTQELLIGSIALAGATALRMAASVILSVYRAHDQFARQTNMLIAFDVVRIIFTIGAVLASALFLTVALGQLIIAALIVFGLINRDVRKRFPAFSWRFGTLRGGELRSATATCFGYWMAAAPSTILTYLPVFLLSFISASAFAIAQFALMRTVSGLARTVLQQFSIVLGQEVARRIAVGDSVGVQSVYRESAILLTVQTAVAAGLLVATADQLFMYWTGRSDIYDEKLLWLSLAPVVAVPALTLAQNFFASANMPWSMVIGRALQMAMSVLFFFLIPIDNNVLRLVLALAIAELLGLGIPVMWKASKVIDGANFWFNSKLFVLGSFCLLCVAVPCVWLGSALSLAPMVKLIIIFLAGIGISLALILMMGLNGDRRHQVGRAIKSVWNRLSMRRDAASR